MVNENQSSNRESFDTTFRITASILFFVAVALRWFRLDLITFRYDQAAIAFRSMDTFNSGFPFTGIINSLGFHNAPGYVWSVLPGFLLSPDPRWATAWHGLLASTMIFPLAILGRRYRRDALRWMPAVLAAVLPASVLAGRNLWAQFLLPPVAAWALLALDTALDPNRSWHQKRRSAALSMAILAWGVSIHFSAGSLLLVVTGFCAVLFKNRYRDLAKALLPAGIICLTLIPSAMDWWEKIQVPPVKPDFVLEYEAVLPDPLPWFVRLPDSAVASVSNSSIEALLGIETLLDNKTAIFVRGFDLIVLMVLLVGGVYGLYRMLRKIPEPASDGRRRLSTVLLAWIILPAVIGGFFVPRVNAGYFLGSLPAGWLLPLLLPAVPRRFSVMAWSFVTALFITGIAIMVLFLSAIVNNGFVPGAYYIPFGKQVEVMKYLKSQDIAPDRVLHLSGGWYQHSYDYIYRYVLQGDEAQKNSEYALMEDKNLLPDEPVRRRYFWKEHPVEFDGVGVKIFPSRGSAEIFARGFYDLGER